MGEMLQRPDMLMIGAGGRNLGKTEFVCHGIRQASAQRDVVGVKVTTIQERDGLCPRVGQVAEDQSSAWHGPKPVREYARSFMVSEFEYAEGL